MRSWYFQIQQTTINKRREENGTLKELRASGREKDPSQLLQADIVSNPQAPYRFRMVSNSLWDWCIRFR